jgi:protein-tyrosine phosphatase
MDKSSAYEPAVLFVCLGNICRSPTAEAVFRRKASESGLNSVIDSAGTGAWHAGERPDARALEHGMKRGYNFHDQTARQAVKADFSRFDYILAMDARNLTALQDLCPPGYSGHLSRFLDFAPHSAVKDVPDPYYGGGAGFETVINLIEDASVGLIRHLKAASNSAKSG